MDYKDYVDYEQRYNSALERAKKSLRAGDEIGKDVVEYIFPELRESEDERIRRKMIEHFKSKTKETWCNMPVKDILAWLEKQKGDKDELVYRLNGLMQDYIKEGKDDEEKEHRLKCYQLFWDALEDANFFEQKGQKPADYDHEMWKNCEANFEGGKKEVIKHPEKYGLQKPTEWSEEDEKIMQTMIKEGDLKPSEIAWLNRIRPSWKPTEDEERLINTSISFLKDFADKGYENAVECVDWLKSKLNGNSGK